MIEIKEDSRVIIFAFFVSVATILFLLWLGLFSGGMLRAAFWSVILLAMLSLLFFRTFKINFFKDLMLFMYGGAIALLLFIIFE